MIDIHAHILPGLDDGPLSLNESLRMCELYVAQGVTTVVATPHLCDTRFAVSPEAVRKGAEDLARTCCERGLELQVLPGGDVRLEPELLQALDAGRALTLGDAGTHLLLELPLQSVPPIEDLLSELSLRGVTAVLSHPERNLEVRRRPQRLARLVQAGCLVQITAGSLLGDFGRPTRKAAEGLLRAGLVHVVATDAHSPRGVRRPALRQAAELVRKLRGAVAVHELFCGNAAKMIGPPGSVGPTTSGAGNVAVAAGALGEEARGGT